MLDNIEKEEDQIQNHIKYDNSQVEDHQNFQNENFINNNNYGKEQEKNNDLENINPDIEQQKLLNNKGIENINENFNNLNIKDTNNFIIEDGNKINIEFEKNNLNKENELKTENLNKINIISNNNEETNIESIKINEYLEQDIKSNKEYNDDENDLRSCRLTERNNNDKYLLIKEESNKNQNKIELYNKDEDEKKEEKEEENLFPFRIIGDVKKKSEIIGKYNSRYLELDSAKGLFKRYSSCKDYPKKPKEVIDIRNFKLIKKIKKVKEYNDLEITFFITNKKGQKVEKVEYFRLRHQECRNKWFDSLIHIWKNLVKGNSVPKITKDTLLFIDDRIGIIQEIGRKNEKKNIKSEINLKKFKILSLLGIGGFGTVFKVRHILTDKIYAMKVMNKNYIIKKKYLHYVVSEFEIMKSLAGFPFVLELHYCFQSANYLYLIVDYCPNGDFTNLKTINNIKLFFAEVILAFEYLHNHNVIYRDLKPENILLDEQGHIKLCDFNLAKAGMTKNKRADSFCGSPMYFSPEMVLKKGVDYKCDIYGIGLLMYEIVTGKPAFNANNIEALYELIKNNVINFKVSGLNGDIKDVIEKMLEKEPEKRIDLDEIKNHPYFKDFNFNKVLKKEYGKIETKKKVKKKKDNNNNDEEEKKLNDEEKEKQEYEKFKLIQQKLDDRKDYTFFDGKITVKEMLLDQKRPMKNYVRGFYYVKKEDIDKIQDFQLDAKEDINITSFIMDDYEFEV